MAKQQVHMVAPAVVPAHLACIAVVAADPQVRRRALEALAEDGLAVVEDGADAATVLSVDETVDLVVLHLATFGTAEAAQVSEVRAERPSIRVVVLTSSDKPRAARKAIDTGVDGLVLDDSIEHALVPTVRAALADQVSVPRQLRPSMQRPSLSFREKQVLGMVVMGFTNAEIARRLFLAESTVKSHLSSAFGKLGVRSRSEASAMILDPNGSLGTGILAITSDLEMPAA